VYASRVDAKRAGRREQTSVIGILSRPPLYYVCVCVCVCVCVTIYYNIYMYVWKRAQDFRGLEYVHALLYNIIPIYAMRDVSDERVRSSSRGPQD
jgi:hypothetical protein